VRIALARLVPVALLAAVLAGCATGSSAYKKGYTAAKVHDWDTAVAHFRTAVQEDPDKPEYRIALERAMMEAAQDAYGSIEETVEEAITQRPLATIGLALGIGFLIGAAWRR